MIQSSVMDLTRWFGTLDASDYLIKRSGNEGCECSAEIY